MRGKKIIAKVFGTPKPQPRPRCVQRGGFVSVYNPKSADFWKGMVQDSLNEYAGMHYEGAIHILLVFYMPRPKSHYGTGRNANLLKDTAPYHHTKTPDIDNLTKAVMDAITDIKVWKDDKQVVAVDAEKRYCTSYGSEGLTIDIEFI